eukprot:gene36559-59691_t
MNLRNEKHRTDAKPIVESGEGSGNYTARFSRAYLRHLTVAGEILSCTLLTLHNLSFYLDLMASARAHIEAGDYGPWHRAWIEPGFSGGSNPVFLAGSRPTASPRASASLARLDRRRWGHDVLIMPTLTFKVSPAEARAIRGKARAERGTVSAFLRPRPDVVKALNSRLEVRAPRKAQFAKL